MLFYHIPFPHFIENLKPVLNITDNFSPMMCFENKKHINKQYINGFNTLNISDALLGEKLYVVDNSLESSGVIFSFTFTKDKKDNLVISNLNQLDALPKGLHMMSIGYYPHHIYAKNLVAIRKPLEVI